MMEQPLLNRSVMIVLQPSSLKESLKLLNENPDAEVIANASDLWPRIRNGEVKPKKLLDISGLVSELSYVKKMVVR
jgi:Aerobic-type carbon monoxide dehydrogenase, middle subunit CoxM/CutM homologs